MSNVHDELEKAFVCSKCHQTGAHVEELAMSGTGLSRLLEVQPYRYAFVSCKNCGFTEVFSKDILAGKDDLGTFLEILFSN
jgi:predicted nucleic-acid-binding Zn-ribbon protein